MKPHDPSTERELLRLALAARSGAKPEPSDPRNLGKRLLGFCHLVFLYGMLAAILGVLQPGSRENCWQVLLVSLFLMGGSFAMLGTLKGFLTERGRHEALANLPIPGERAARWARSWLLARHGITGLACCALGTIALDGFSDSAAQWLARLAPIVFVTTATVILIDDEWLRRARIIRVWAFSMLLAGIGMIVLIFVHKRIFASGGTPDELAVFIEALAWIYPPSWAMPGRLENGGGLLSFAWCVWGLRRWMTWPRIAGEYFDTPGDFIGHPDLEDDEDAADDDSPWFPGNRPADDAEEESPPVHPAGARHALPGPLGIPETGWVDRWIHRWLSPRDKIIAGALADVNRSWTPQTMWFLKGSPLLLLALWAFVRGYPESGWKDTIMIWCWILAVAAPLVTLLPFTNALPRASADWPLGNLTLPFFSMLPITCRDLLRVSSRITLARCLVMTPVAMAYMAVLLIVMPSDLPPRIVCWGVPAFGCFWITSRPVFVWYRLQAANCRRRGAWLVYTLGMLPSVALLFVWLAAGVAGVVAGCAFFEPGMSSADLGFTAMIAFGGLGASALCSRAVFEIHHWHLRRRRLDWVAQP